MTVLSFPIKFETTVGARTFVRRIVPLLEIPCLVNAETVHVCVHIEDFDAVTSYAMQFGGTVQYGSTWNFRKAIVDRLK